MSRIAEKCSCITRDNYDNESKEEGFSTHQMYGEAASPTLRPGDGVCVNPPTTAE